jgi:hypothetical protein
MQARRNHTCGKFSGAKPEAQLPAGLASGQFVVVFWSSLDFVGKLFSLSGLKKLVARY